VTVDELRERLGELPGYYDVRLSVVVFDGFSESWETKYATDVRIAGECYPAVEIS
jgi:hypothetical protein